MVSRYSNIIATIAVSLLLTMKQIDGFHLSVQHPKRTNMIPNTQIQSTTFFKRNKDNDVITTTSSLHMGIDYDSLDDECEFFVENINPVPVGAGGEEIQQTMEEVLSQEELAARFAKCMIQKPSPDFEAEDVVFLCMDALQNNDQPTPNAGVETCFNFSSDRCKAANGGTLEAFISKSSNPTFRSMTNSIEWQTLNVGNEIAGTPTRGAMKTILVSVTPNSREVRTERKFLWTMQKERRPPLQGCWLVHECIAVDQAHIKTE